MIGPEISSKWDKQCVENSFNDGTKYSLLIQAPTANKVLLHDHPAFQEKLLNSDVFALFNPVS